MNSANDMNSVNNKSNVPVNWNGMLMSLRFYTVLVLVVYALQIKNPGLISTIASPIIIAAVVLSGAAAIYLLVKIKVAKEQRKLFEAVLFILLTCAENVMLIQNM